MHIALLNFKFGGGGPPAVAVALRAYPKLELGRNDPSGMGGPITWEDITGLWRSDVPIVWVYGIQGNSAADRVADAGSLQFCLDDGARPSNPLGYTSILSGDRKVNFNINAPIRYSLGQSVGTRYFKFYGALADVIPQPGRHGDRRSFCTALDMWDDFAQMPMPSLPPQINQRSDQLATTLLDVLLLPTPHRVIETGSITFPYAFEGSSGQGMVVREVLQQICLSEFGYAYRKGDLLNGDTIVVENRQHRTANPAALFALDESMITSMDVPGSRDDLYHTIRILFHPITTDTLANTVLFSLEGATLTVAGNSEIQVVFGPYRNPNRNETLVGGTDMQPPVAGTDYTMNLVFDGSGTDLTLNFQVFAFYTGNGVEYRIVNTGATAAFVTKLQARGRGIYRIDTGIERQPTTQYGYQVLEVDHLLPTPANDASDVANVLAIRYSAPVANVSSVTFCATRTQTLFDQAMQREPGDRITVSEPVVGMYSRPFTINSVRLQVDQAGILWCT